MILTVTGDFADIFRVSCIRLTPVFIVDLEDSVITAAIETAFVVGPRIETTFPVGKTEPCRKKESYTLAGLSCIETDWRSGR